MNYVNRILLIGLKVIKKSRIKDVDWFDVWQLNRQHATYYRLKIDSSSNVFYWVLLKSRSNIKYIRFCNKQKIQAFEDPILDNSLVSLHEYTYKPYRSPNYKNSDEIRIPLHFQDLILLQIVTSILRKNLHRLILYNFVIYPVTH